MKQLLQPQQLHDYQRKALMHMIQNDDSMLWLGMGLGKAQPVSEPVLTPDGWVPMGELKHGSMVVGSDGLPTKVMSIHPQGEREIVKITFNDGSSTRCDWDHLWNVRTDKDKHRGKLYRTMTTREIVESGLTFHNGKNGDVLKWQIPMTKPVQHETSDYPINPYLLGVILGDAHISNKYGTVVCTDIETIIECGLTVSKPHESSEYTAYAYVKGVKHVMRELGLVDKRSWEKFIPAGYMIGDIEQRLSLLQGLLDTDGTPISGGGVEFSSTSENLINSVIELTESLGGTARNKTSRIPKHQKGEGRESWRVNVKLPSEFKPFRLKRKLDKWQRPTKYQPARKIKSIEVCGVENAQCIRVDAEDNLYLTRHHIVTHNTPITLTAIVDRMRSGHVKKTLIFGPLRVIQAVWAREARKWEHTEHLRFSIMHGNKEKRQRALFADADIYLCNYENMNWLAQELDHYYVSQGKPLPFEMVVYDEVSKLKNSTTKRVKGGTRDVIDNFGHPHKVKLIGWRKILNHFKFRVGLTGTPASNGYLDLHGQFLAVDGGKRLGEHITKFKDRFFTSDYMGYSYEVTDRGKEFIEEAIADITIKMDAKEYLDLPDCTTTNMMVTLPPKARKAYDEVEKHMFTALESGSEIEVLSRSSVYNKCLQFCNGTPYLSPESPEFEELHAAKLDALDEVLEEAAGNPVLCSYSFQSDAKRIMKKFGKKYKCVNLTESKSSDTEKIINDWNNGKIHLLIGHPASMGHGVDGLQDAGNIVVWFGCNWSLELYEQMNARIDRQGQKRPVSIIRILCEDSVDLAVVDALERKTDDQEGLKRALQRYRDGITTNDLETNFF